MIAHLPRSIGVTACRTVDGLASAFDAGISNIFPAIASIPLLKGVCGRDLILNAGIGIAPRDAVAISSAFQNLAGTGLIGFIHAAPDIPADEDPDDRACHDAEWLVIVGADLRSDYCPDGPAKNGPDRLAATGALADSEIIDIGIIGNVMVFIMLVLAPVAMCWRPRRGASAGLIIVFRIVMFTMTMSDSSLPRRVAKADSRQHQ